MACRTQVVARRLVAVLFVTFVLVEGVWSVAQAQEGSHTASSSRAVRLKEGTEVKLKLHDRITSKTAVEGNRLSRGQGRNAGQTW
jgi:hypothetical protein